MEKLQPMKSISLDLRYIIITLKFQFSLSFQCKPDNYCVFFCCCNRGRFSIKHKLWTTLSVRLALL